jgi:hypothetical protein
MFTDDEMKLIEAAVDNAKIDLPEDLMHKLYDYFMDLGDMPYGVAKARSGDPWEWIYEHLDNVTR